MAVVTSAPTADRAPTLWMTGTALVTIAVVVLALGVEYLLGLAVIAGFVGLALAAARVSIVALAVYAPLAAGLRRFLDFGLFSESGLTAADLVLLPIPVTTVVLTMLAVRRGALRDRSPAMNAVLVLLTIAVAGVLNPLQGGVSVGVVGLAYLGVPFLWFIVAKVFVDDDLLRRVLLAYVVVAIPIAAYAILGGLDILLPWDRAFLEVATLGMIFVRGTARPLSTLASPEELGRFLAATTLIAGTLLLASRPTWRARGAVVALIGLLLVALAFSGMRAASILLVFATGLVVAARLGVRPVPALGVGVLALVLLIGAARVVGSFGPTGHTFIDRQVSGLSAPWDVRQSTLVHHIEVQRLVALHLPTRPLGLGTGSTTPAASRLGSGSLVTESDIGDAAVAWGFPGLAAYLAVVVLAVRSALQVAWRRRDPLALAALGVLGAMLLRWTEGGMYAMAPLVWICFGWFDRTAAASAE